MKETIRKPYVNIGQQKNYEYFIIKKVLKNKIVMKYTEN